MAKEQAAPTVAKEQYDAAVALLKQAPARQVIHDEIYWRWKKRVEAWLEQNT